MVGAPTISLYSWKQLAYWSIEYSCLSDKDKALGYKHLAASWKTFCTTVVKDFKHHLMQENGTDIDEAKAKAAYKAMPKVNRGMGRPNNNADA